MSHYRHDSSFQCTDLTQPTPALMPFPPEMPPSLPSPTPGYRPHPHSHSFPWDLARWFGSPWVLGVLRPVSHLLKSEKWPNSTSSLDSSYLPSLCCFSIIWAVSMIQSKAVQLASQDHSVFLSFETESSRSKDCQRASYWVKHAFLINYIWLP